MTAQTTNYQCPTCTGPLHFNSADGNLHCEYCSSSFSVSEIEALYAAKTNAAAEAMQAQAAQESQSEPGAAAVLQDVQAAEQAEQSAWGCDKLTGDWGQEAVHMRVYSCPSCAAEILCDETTAATSCLYCGNPTVVPGQFAGVLKPDYVLPFRLDKQAAMQALKKHCEKKLFLPKFFAKEAHVEEIKGVYVPFWLFDGTAHTDVQYNAGKSSSHVVGDYRITTTHHYKVRRAGTVSFQDIPVDASSKMPNDYMESIEPFDYTQLAPFQMAYMPGYLADKYDVTAEMCGKRADERAQDSTLDVMRSSVVGYTQCTQVGHNTQLQRGDVHYAMAPVWLLTTRWRGKVYLFAMNGQTGKFVGDLPCSRGRFWAYTTLVTLGLSALGSFIWFIIL